MVHVYTMTSWGTTFKGILVTWYDMEEFLRMQTFLRLAYMYQVLRIPLKEVPLDIISSSQQ